MRAATSTGFSSKPRPWQQGMCPDPTHRYRHERPARRKKPHRNRPELDLVSRVCGTLPREPLPIGKTRLGRIWTGDLRLMRKTLPSMRNLATYFSLLRRLVLGGARSSALTTPLPRAMSISPKMTAAEQPSMASTSRRRAKWCCRVELQRYLILLEIQLPGGN